LVTGLQGEQVALDYLRQQGWKLIDRNVRALGGEIDLVMLDEGTIVFVEVKTWGSKTDEDPAEAVDLYKQRTLTRAGLAFLQKKGSKGQHDSMWCRCDYRRTPSVIGLGSRSVR
jgi:putative endonuclease